MIVLCKDKFFSIIVSDCFALTEAKMDATLHTVSFVVTMLAVFSTAWMAIDGTMPFLPAALICMSLITTNVYLYREYAS